jgi:hypothetical protein
MVALILLVHVEPSPRSQTRAGDKVVDTALCLHCATSQRGGDAPPITHCCRGLMAAATVLWVGSCCPQTLAAVLETGEVCPWARHRCCLWLGVLERTKASFGHVIPQFMLTPVGMLTMAKMNRNRCDYQGTGSV